MKTTALQGDRPLFSAYCYYQTVERYLLMSKDYVYAFPIKKNIEASVYVYNMAGKCMHLGYDNIRTKSHLL